MPAFLVNIVAHIDIPRLPLPFPAGIGNLCVGDVDRGVLEVLGHPRSRIKVEER